jgi:hypothetical protein
MRGWNDWWVGCVMPLYWLALTGNHSLLLDMIFYCVMHWLKLLKSIGTDLVGNYTAVDSV